MHHDGGVSETGNGHLRAATPHDHDELIRLWALLFDDDGTATEDQWRRHATGWFIHAVHDQNSARFPVIEVHGTLVATAIGTLEQGVPNPYSSRGRTVRLSNVLTLPEHRGHGYGTRLVLDVLDWARSVDADRVDLSATPEGRRLYEKLGFTVASAPRMKLML